MLRGTDWEVSGLNPGGVKCISTGLSFKSNSSDISRFMFVHARALSNRFLLALVEVDKGN